jgi:hypothetical protein
MTGPFGFAATSRKAQKRRRQKRIADAETDGVQRHLFTFFIAKKVTKTLGLTAFAQKYYAPSAKTYKLLLLVLSFVPHSSPNVVRQDTFLRSLVLDFWLIR